MTPSSETLNAVSAVRAALTPGAMARRTRRVYDRLASIYPASSYLFHPARSITAEDLVEGSHRSSLDELTQWTTWADKVLVF